MSIENGVVRMFEGSVEFKENHGINLTKGNALLKGVRMTYTSNNKTAGFIKVESGTVMVENTTITGNDKKWCPDAA
ncbi:hypothetical protein [Bartonella bovis]|uniref:hypothetical protein n=1 Tax=Bartonella bovis TaxID=155194 RepID=UPI000AABEC84|nr:hypothetical protein [Bartonella bovis]